MAQKRYNFDNEWTSEKFRGLSTEVNRAGYVATLGKRPRMTKEPNEYPFQSMADEDYQGVVKLGGVDLGIVEMSASMSKNIITTPINGKRGTVKEKWSDGDVQITMRIKVMSNDNGYPSEAVKRVMDVMMRDETQDVVSQWLNDVWNVTRLVVRDVRMSGRVDRNYEVIDVGAVSDEDYIIEEEFDK